MAEKFSDQLGVQEAYDSILTISYNDLTISHGPAIHYLELWDAFHLLYGDQYQVIGLAPVWNPARSLIKSPAVDLKIIKTLNIPKLKHILYDLKIGWHLLKNKRNNKTSLVYLRTASFHLFALLAVKLRGFDMIVEMNGLAAADADARGRMILKRFARWQERRLLIHAKKVISVTPEISAYVERQCDKPAPVIAIGVKEDLFDIERVYKQRPARIIFVGTLTAWDGAARILELAAFYPQIEFMIVGPEEKSALKQQASANISFTGEVPYVRLNQYYKQADAGIALYDSRRHEMTGASSLKCLEYAAAGLDVFVEKPMAQSAGQGRDLVKLARDAGAVLMVGHLLHYHPSMVELKRLAHQGALGELRYIYSNRVNTGIRSY